MKAPMKVPMKHRNKSVFAASLLMGALAFLGACSSTGMERSEKASASMSAVEQDLLQADLQITNTSVSLDELIRPGQPNVKEAFNKYSADVDKMDAVGKRILDHSDKMSDQGKDYFNEWRKQGNTYNSSEIQALSEQRRADLTAVLARIPEAGVGVRGALTSYLSDNREIRTYLANDLTSKGIETITPIAQNSVTDGARLKEAVKPLLSAISEARVALAPAGAPVSSDRQ